MSKFTNPLDRVTIAAPCPASWNDMTGDTRVRFCGSCEKNVYNLSGMSKRDAEALLINAASGARLCVRFYRRADGTILTQNCPVGLRLLKRRVTGAASALLSALLSFGAGLGLSAWRKEQVAAPPDTYPMLGAITTVDKVPVETVPDAEPPPSEDYIMGDIQDYSMGQPVVGRVVPIPQPPVHKSIKRVRRSR